MHNTNDYNPYIFVGKRINSNLEVTGNLWITHRELVDKYYIYAREDSRISASLGNIQKDAEKILKYKPEIIKDMVHKRYYTSEDSVLEDLSQKIDITIDRYYKEYLDTVYNTVYNVQPKSEEDYRNKQIIDKIVNRLSFQMGVSSKNWELRNRKWIYDLKRSLGRHGFTISKKTSTNIPYDSFNKYPNAYVNSIFDYNSIEKDINYKALYKEEIKDAEANCWDAVFANAKIGVKEDFTSFAISDETIKLYMKKFHPKIYFLYKHSEIFDKD